MAVDRSVVVDVAAAAVPVVRSVVDVAAVAAGDGAPAEAVAPKQQ